MLLPRKGRIDEEFFFQYGWDLTGLYNVSPRD